MSLPSRCLSVIALASMLFCDAASPAVAEPDGSPQISGSTVVMAGIGAGVVIGTVALIELFHRKRTIRGCVTEGPDGLQIVDEKTQVKYILRGNEDSVQPDQTAAIRGRKKHKKQMCASDGLLLAPSATAPRPTQEWYAIVRQLWGRGERR